MVGDEEKERGYSRTTGAARVSEPLSSGLLKCPRCRAPLLEMPGDTKWASHWRCDDCLLAFHFVRGRLVQGRTAREIAARIDALANSEDFI